MVLCVQNSLQYWDWEIISLCPVTHGKHNVTKFQVLLTFSFFFDGFINMAKQNWLSLCGEGLCKDTQNCGSKGNSFPHFFTPQPQNKIHPKCLAFTCHALWVSLSPVVTSERADLSEQSFALDFFFFWRHVLILQSSREEAVPGYGLAEQRPWSIRSVYHQVASAQYRSSTSGYAYRILLTKGRCLPKYCQFNSSWTGFNLKILSFQPWLKQIRHNDRQLGFNFMSYLFFCFFLENVASYFHRLILESFIPI